ncbi:54S ribosomal protein-like protein [Emericellopsis cladophorae]|uniref:54S ribosomal protein-like protein n=1 Tax=Emericellopsis cladophorae TaxID=2686198 RepID=A0A9Q0BB62_9HYPO|nr:54S ribosomal protein-like protein [Emericellopsis cladophorae]KAI6779492.1 54S ribosomal protein-like protein [Emericellopsis cladophorae]
MTLRVAARHLGQPAALPSSVLALRLGPAVQVRHKWSLGSLFGGKGAKNDKGPGIGSDLDNPEVRKRFLKASKPKTRPAADEPAGVFADELQEAEKETAQSLSRDGSGVPENAPQSFEEQLEVARREALTHEGTHIAIDPDPASRVQWQRRKVIQMVRRRGVLTPQERIKMTERELLHKSAWLPTSTKKLVMLSRQIAGKTVDDAITQMQWSKKKMAREIKWYLEQARDLAITQQGMGLGRVNGELLKQPKKIQTKDGTWMEIRDPTRMYVAQSWVGRGDWRGKHTDIKGRGRMGIIQNPKASFTVILKEERTRIREYQEREAKKLAEGPWVHLPNRKVYGQRPYYSW